ncbi:MAG TPA: drug:proton antiporter, partial [Rhodobacteraceae bacterium]|nr:drug:proton antiporter [Paracoccaceae bacterium]
MSLAYSATIARRELRGGLNGFRIFLLCLLLGVAAIAGIGTVRSAIDAGLASEAASLLGGDAEMQFTHRKASDTERAWIASNSLASSEILTFRSMLQAGPESAPIPGLSQVKAVDENYPLFGEVTLSPAMPLQAALAVQNGTPGVVLHPALIDRMEVEIGDTIRMGAQNFQLRAAITSEPDGSISDIGLGPRT